MCRKSEQIYNLTKSRILMIHAPPNKQQYVTLVQFQLSPIPLGELASTYTKTVYMNTHRSSRNNKTLTFCTSYIVIIKKTFNETKTRWKQKPLVTLPWQRDQAAERARSVGLFMHCKLWTIQLLWTLTQQKDSQSCMALGCQNNASMSKKTTFTQRNGRPLHHHHWKINFRLW